MAIIKAYMICHTHWDREWYFTREEFRVKLVRLIDELLDMIETVPDYVSFMLDGQTIVIEDYLEIRPENRERLSNAMHAGKIICGPWYILPDELLVSGESLIRNYMMGNRVTDGMGGKMKIAYLPDSFGHPQQLPQIVRGLGMDMMVFWRGTADFMEKTEFYWQSPHEGTKILCLHMPFGYSNCCKLDEAMDVTAPRLNSMIESLGARSTTDIVLLMNGSDHIAGQKDIVKIVNDFNQIPGGHRIQLSTLERFGADLKSNLHDLKTYRGEFRYSERTMLLGGTLSTRMQLKQDNFVVQRDMERYIEPVLAWEALAGGSADLGDYCVYLWKAILENQPHDSICGCSVDEVHAEMSARLRCVKQLESVLLGDAFQRIEMLAMPAGQPAGAQLMLFEPTQDGQPAYVEADIDFDMALVQKVNFSKSIIEDFESQFVHPPAPEGLKIVDDRGREIEYVILATQKAYDTHYQDKNMPEVYKVNRVRVGMLLPDYSYGVHLLNIGRSEKTRPVSAGAGDMGISNEFYGITFENGAFTVLDKRTGMLHKGVHRLIDKGDAGDEYTYSWPQNDREYSLDASLTRVKTEQVGALCHRLVVEGNLRLPERLSGDRKSRSDPLVVSPVRITVSLYKGIDRIDFKTELENNSDDHRLQTEFPSGIHTQRSCSSGTFGITERAIAPQIPEQWMEYPQSTHPTHGFMELSDGKYGLAAAACGLTEFEAAEYGGQTVLRITLLRCVGWLSRTDLFTRKGNGGWTIATPDAQCRGKHVFEYCIAYHAQDTHHGSTYGLMEKMLHPPALRQMRNTGNHKRFVSNPLGFISQLPRDVRLSTAKISENGGSMILRVYSIAEKDRKVRLRLPAGVREAFTTNMAEERQGKTEISGGRMSFVIEPAQIVTLELVYECNGSADPCPS